MDFHNPAAFTTGEEFSAAFLRAGADSVETYLSAAGEVTVTRSTRDRVEGTFRIQAFRSCVRAIFGDSRPECTPPTAPIPAASRIEITGSFSAAGRDAREPW